jgi:hypothetical protein
MRVFRISRRKSVDSNVGEISVSGISIEAATQIKAAMSKVYSTIQGNLKLLSV